MSSLSPDELKAQLKELMQIPENMVCLDCRDKRPMWASLIVPPPGAPFPTIGCFCCYQCSGAHRRMGTHICFVRSTNLDEWKEKELIAMKLGGNRLINAIFEASLTKAQKDMVKPTNETDMEARANFIYDKYQHRKFYNLASYEAVSKHTFAKSPPRPAKPSAGSGDFDFPDLSSGRANQRAGSVFLEDFVKDQDTEWWKMNASKVAKPDEFNRSLNSSGANDVHFDPRFSASHRGASSSSIPEASPGGTRLPRRGSALVEGRQSKSLMQTLQRMESKSRLLDDIKHMDIDRDDPAPMAKPSRTSRTRRRDPNSRPVRKPGNLDEEKPTAENKDRRPPPPTRVKASGDVDSGVSRQASGDPATAPDVSAATERRRHVGRTKSSESPVLTGSRKTPGGGEDRNESKPESSRSMMSSDSSNRKTSGRRTPEASSSFSGGVVIADDELQRLSRLTTGSEHTTGSSASSRRPRRGVARTKSMDTDLESSKGSRPRDASTTRRRPPRVTNSSGELRPPRGHESMGDFGGQAETSMSELSTRSGPEDLKPLSRNSDRRSPHRDDDILPSSSRSGRSRATDESAKRSERALSVGAKAGKEQGKPPPKARSPLRDVQSSSRMPRRGSNRGSGDTRTPSPPGGDAGLRRGGGPRSPSEAIPPRATRSPRPNKPISARNDSTKMEALGRLLSGS